MKTLAILIVCALGSLCLSTGDFADPDTPNDSAPVAASHPASSSASDSSSSSSESDSASSESDSASSESDSSSSSSSSSDSPPVASTEAEPEEENEVTHVFAKRDLAVALLRRHRMKRAVSKTLTRGQLESLSEVCELNVACDHMAETAGIVAAYTAYYGPVPF